MAHTNVEDCLIEQGNLLLVDNIGTRLNSGSVNHVSYLVHMAQGTVGLVGSGGLLFACFLLPNRYTFSRMDRLLLAAIVRKAVGWTMWCQLHHWIPRGSEDQEGSKNVMKERRGILRLEGKKADRQHIGLGQTAADSDKR